MISLERKRLDEQFGQGKVPLFLVGHSMVSNATIAQWYSRLTHVFV